MRIRLFSPLALLTAFASFAGAQQQDLAGNGQYPQFRVYSGLPGGGFGVLPNGRPGIGGAAALATPIGYTLRGGRGALALFNTTKNLNPIQFDGGQGTEQDTNGTFAAMAGATYKGFNLSWSFMVLSTELDSVQNAQISPPLKGRLGLAFGVQDIYGGGGSAGTGVPGADDGRSSRSFYGVGTYDLGRQAYVSLGVGDRRFHGVFGNASALVAPRMRAILEYDSYNFNGGLLYNFGRMKNWKGRAGEVEVNLFAGLVRGKYATLGLTATL